MIVVKLREVMATYSSRNACKITYQDLADLSGLSKATLEAIGSRPDYNATLSVLETLCKILDCSISDLIEYSRDEE